MPLFSIIIPVYNNKNYLCDCVDSILSQNFKDYEIILIDDGSTDGSELLCDAYARQDNIKAYHIGNKGVSYARNKGIEEAEGEYIWFVDSDDTVIPDSLDILTETVKSTKTDFISFGITEYYIKNGETVKETKKVYEKQCFNDMSTAFSFFQHNDLLDLVADKICRRNVIVENKILFNQEDVPTEDHLLWLSVYPHLKNAVVIDKPLYNYFLRQGNSSTKKLRYYKFKAYSKALKTMITLAQNYGVFDDMQEYLYRYYCYYLFWEFEILNHPDCNFGLIKRYKYFKETFKTNDFDNEFKANALKYYFSTNKIEKTKIRNAIIEKLVYNKFLYPAVLSFAVRLKNKN